MMWTLCCMTDCQLSVSTMRGCQTLLQRQCKDRACRRTM
jgi:hypothetical protein